MHGSVIGRTRSAIIGLLLLLVTWRNNDSCNGLQYQPVDAYADGDDCALIVNGPGRTSVFDYTYNLLRGSFQPSARSQTCITYDAVNRAYLEARKRINVAQPKNKMWRPEDLATVGELLLDISTNLANTYGLTYEEIDHSLPLIDTSKTLIRDICPAYLSNVECRAGKYRRNDGLCTNLQNPTWGSSLSPFQRLMSPRYADGLTAPRISITGHDLPLSRVVSRTMHPDEGYHDHAGTVMVIAWGQFMDHDYTLTATPLDPLNRNDPEECCHRPPHLKNPYCNEILIPEDDYFYRLFNVKCQDFVRAFPAVRPGCRLGPRVPFNLLTGVLDGNTVYGITETFARKLRTGYGGLLRMNPVFSEYGLKDLLPLKLDIPDEGCTRPNRSMYCFEAGEIRVNEQLVLTCMHTLMAREHNRIAKELIQINPHWDDETLYQETRRIVIAQIQHITYNEFLPILLGKDVMEKFGLLLEKNTYWDGYDESVNPAVIDAFASAAFRFGHSLLPTAVERWSKAHKFIASKRLSNLIRRPFDLYRAGVFDEYIMGLMNQVAQAMDDSITQEVTNHLFKKAGAKFGMDLVSFNMQRGREFGIPSYMEFRKFCGLPWVDTFDELQGSMPNETIRRYNSIFEHPADVDLWSGGVSERPLPGSMLGPTFACVIATQFSYSRRGDRFWYELPNQPSSFTLEQLNEIRKVKLAKVICDNTDLIDTIQIYPMVLPDHEINPRVPCRSGILPSMDLSKWAEFPTANHAQYNGDATPAYAPRTRIESPPDGRSAVEEIEKIVSTKKMRDNIEERLKAAHPAASSAINKKTANDYDVDNSIRHPDNVNRESSVAAHGTRMTYLESNVRIGEKIVDISETLNNRRKGTTAGRFERSLGKKTDYVGAGEQAPRSERLYRHPNLSYEEQRKQIDEESRAGGANLNFGGPTNKRVPEVQSSTKSKVEIVTPLTESRKRAYVPVLPGCNDTALSNAGHAGRAVQNGLKNDNGKNGNAAKPGKREKLKQDAATANGMHKKEQGKNKGYINIRDLQKNEGSTTSPDVPVYDPNKIPYVDVPDYSDIREESLDEQDRRANKSGMKGKEDGFADPEVTVDFRESSKSVIDDESNKGSAKETASLTNTTKKQKSGDKKNPVGANLNGKKSDNKSVDSSTIGTPEESNKDEPSGNPKQSTIDKGNSSALRSEPAVSGIPTDFPNPSKYSNSYEFTENSEDERPKGSRQSLNSQNDSNNSNVGDEKSEESSEEEDSRVSPVDSMGMQGERNSGGRAGTIIFDINEYRKPFDLDEFLKDDPIMKKLALLEKETPAKYGGNGKRVSSDFNESESVNAFKEPHVRDHTTGKGDTFDDLSKSHQPADFTDVFIKIARNDRGERRGSNGSVKKSRTAENPDEEVNDEDSWTEDHDSSRFDDVDEFLSKRFTDDVARNLRLRDTVKEDRGRTDSERKEDTYHALPAILSKKTRVLRLDEDTGRRIKATDVPTVGYKNFWSLEYKSPIRRVDMEAQERRK